MRWVAVAPLRFEERTKLDETAPLPPDARWAGREHALVTGVWEWVPAAGERFQLAVPKGEPVDTLMWRVEAGAAEEAPVKWMMLISGDETEWMGPVGVAAGMRWGWLLGSVVALVGMWWVRSRVGFR